MNSLLRSGSSPQLRSLSWGSPDEDTEILVGFENLDAPSPTSLLVSTSLGAGYSENGATAGKANNFSS